MSKPLKIIYLCQHFPPETGAPQIRVYEVSKELLNQGHEIQVVTAFPHHPHGIIPDEYKGMKYHFEKLDGIPVHRTWIYPSQKGVFWKRLISYFSFTFSSFYGLLKAGKVNYIIVNSPPIFLGITGWLAAKLTGAKFIFNVADVWPESAVKLGLIKNKFAIKLTEKLESFLYKSSWKVAAATDGIQEYVIQHSQPAEKVFVLPNGVNTDFFSYQSKNKTKPFTFVYAGNLGYAQGIDVVIRAFALVKKMHPEARFVIAGAGPEEQKLKEEVNRLDVQDVTFLGHLPLSEMPALFHESHVSIVPLRNLALFEGARPSKIFPALATGTPVLYCGKGESAEILTRNHCGLVAEPENEQSIAEQMTRAIEMNEEEFEQLSRNGRNLVEREFSWKTIVDSLLTNLKNK